jgi:hypothetical protein
LRSGNKLRANFLRLHATDGLEDLEEQQAAATDRLKHRWYRLLGKSGGGLKRGRVDAFANVWFLQMDDGIGDGGAEQVSFEFHEPSSWRCRRP